MEKRYVDGFVIAMPKKKLDEYKKMASAGGKIWMKYGALQYVECVGEDLESAAKWGCLPFPKLAKVKSDEIVIFSFIVYKSKKQRDEINAKIMKDPMMNDIMKDKPMPFEMKRMAVGGFETLVNLREK